MSISLERLGKIQDISTEMRRQYRSRETPVAKPFQAVELEQLGRDIQAAFGPTLQYMEGMDPYAR